MAGNALMATGLDRPQIDTMGDFAAGASARQTFDDNQITLARKGLENIGSIALGAMGGKLDGQVDPARFEQGLDLLEQQGINVKGFRGRPEVAPIAARASMSALQQLQSANDQRTYDLAMKKFEADMASAAKGPAPTDDMKELAQINAERQAAGKPPVGMEEFLASKGAGSGLSITTADGTVISQGGKGANAYDIEDAKSKVKLSTEIAAAGRSGAAQLSSLSKMKELLGNDSVYTGIGADQVTALQRLGKAFGVESGIADTESFNALSKSAVLDKMGGSLGTGVSNADRDYIDAQVPSLGNTKDGNLQLIDIMSKVAKRQVDVAKFAAEYKRAHGGRLDFEFDDALATWAEANPLFSTEAPAAAPAAPAPAVVKPNPPAPGTPEDGIIDWTDPSIGWEQ